MKFSIITVCFNNLDGLKKTYESILDLDIIDIEFEWIVVDGLSNDGTVEYLQGLDFSRLKWISEKDTGIYNAMNKGILLAIGEYCIFMNSGDYFYNKGILALSAKSSGFGSSDILYGDSYEEEADKKYLKKARLPKYNFYSLFTHHQSIFYRRKILSLGYDETYIVAADWAITSKILRLSDNTPFYLGAVVSVFERGGVSQRSDYRSLINQEHLRVLREEVGLPFVLAKTVWIAKLSVNRFRKLMPSVYDKIRYRNF
jgi:putative colanic acid biosynthesis glycosyltransferase